MKSKPYKIFMRPNDCDGQATTLFVFNGQWDRRDVETTLLDDGYDFFEYSPSHAGSYYQRTAVYPMGSRTVAYLWQSFDV